MLKTHASVLAVGLLAIDVALSCGVFLAVFGEGQGAHPPTDLATLLIMGMVAALAFPLVIDQLGLYRSQRRVSLTHLLGRMILASVIVAGLLSATALALRRPEWVRWAVSCSLLQLVVLGCVRLLVFSALRLFRRLGRNYRDVIVVGTGARARSVRDEIREHPEWGIRILAFIDDTESATDPALRSEPIFKLSKFSDLVREEVVDEVILATPRSMLSLVAPVVAECAQVGVPVTMLSDVFGDYLPNPQPTRLGRLDAISFAKVRHNRFELAAKRLVDIVGGASLLLLSAPVVAVAALAIRRDSPGPILFRQVRCGLHGRPFEMLKLRSMVVEAESLRAELLECNEMDGPVFKLHDDPRETRVGHWLRLWSIDELPQLWNVVRGDMSLVGPRPPIPSEVECYRASERRRLSMRPGITCLWQVGGRNEIAFEDWVKLDLEYIDHWSLGLDVSILLRTPGAVLQRRGVR